MKITPILAGAAAGVVLAAGGIVALDAVTSSADAQSGERFATKAELQSADRRAIRSIKQGTKAWNLLGKYLAQPGELVAVNSPRVSQDRGVGGGLPEEVLSADVRAKLNAGGLAGPPGPPGPDGGDAGTLGGKTAAELQTLQRTTRNTVGETIGNSLNRTAVIPEVTDAPAGDGYEVTFLATLNVDASSDGDPMNCEFTDGEGTAYGPTQIFSMFGGTHTVTMVGRRGPDAGGLEGVDVTCWTTAANLIFEDGSLSVISTPVA